MFGLMFCAAGFIIICTLLRCIICLQTPERLDKGLAWSIRETVRSSSLLSSSFYHGSLADIYESACRHPLHQRTRHQTSLPQLAERLLGQALWHVRPGLEPSNNRW